MCLLVVASENNKRQICYKRNKSPKRDYVPYILIMTISLITNYEKFVIIEDLPSCLKISIIDSEQVP